MEFWMTTTTMLRQSSITIPLFVVVAFIYKFLLMLVWCENIYYTTTDMKEDPKSKNIKMICVWCKYTSKLNNICFTDMYGAFSLIHLIGKSYNDPQKMLFGVLPYHTAIPNNFFFPWDMLYLQRINKDLQ